MRTELPITRFPMKNLLRRPGDRGRYAIKDTPLNIKDPISLLDGILEEHRRVHTEHSTTAG